MKVEHRTLVWSTVLGWRPVVAGRFAGLLLAEESRQVGCAALSMPAQHQEALFAMLDAYGERSSAGDLLLPGDLEAEVDFLERTATGQLREAVAKRLRPSI